MKNRLKLIIAVVAIAIAVSCGAVKESDEIGRQFYKCLKESNYDEAVKLLDAEAVNNTKLAIWTEGLRRKGEDLGMILNVERSDFESETSNNVTRTAIKYKVHYSKGTMYERLEFIQRDSEYKITFYQYDEDSTKVK